MRTLKTARGITLGLAVLAIGALSVPLGSQALPNATTPNGAPRATTGGALHLLATSTQLTAAINPNGTETTYYFQYGQTTAYGQQTTPVSAGSGSLRVKVGQPISHLLMGTTYHYRVVATNPIGTVTGRDRILTTKSSGLKFVMPKPADDVFGSPAVLSGTLTGLGASNHRISLQATPYPYLESFTAIGTPGVTDAGGRFSFRVANLTSNTQFRVVTFDTRPIYSPVVRMGVDVRVTLKARSRGGGLVRLYGTVTPAVKKGQVYFQVLKTVRPGKSEATTKYVTQFSTAVKRATKSVSHFSIITRIRNGGRYRAFVKLPATGPLQSGTSRQTVTLHAAPSSRHK